MITILINLIVSISATVMILFIFYYFFVKPLMKEKLLNYWEMLHKENERKGARFTSSGKSDKKYSSKFPESTHNNTNKPEYKLSLEKSFENNKEVRYRTIRMDTTHAEEPIRKKAGTSAPLNFKFDTSQQQSYDREFNAPGQKASFQKNSPPRQQQSWYQKFKAPQQQPYDLESEANKPPHDKMDAFQHIYTFMNIALKAVREIITFIESDSPSYYNDMRGFMNQLERNIENIFKYQASNTMYFNQQIDAKIKDILYSLKTIRQHMVIYERRNFQNISQEIISNWGNIESDIKNDLQLLKSYFEIDLKNSPEKSKG